MFIIRRRYFYLVSVFVITLLSCKKESKPAGPTQWPGGADSSKETPVIESYKIGGQIISADSLQLVWSDEFNVDGMVNTNDWTYEEGFVRNQEIQYYTVNRPENCKISDGYLVITGRKESTSFGSSSFSDGTYTSASIKTNKKHSWKYGRFEVKAKVPSGKGPWPAFWAKGDSQNEGAGWPACGEVDIMEYSAKVSTMYQNMIYGDDSNSPVQNVKKTKRDFSDDFHTYSMDWSENRIVFAIDNIVTNVIDISKISPNPFRQKFSILINLALGASTERTLGGKLDPSSLPAVLKVDYVRIYQEK